MRELLPRLSDNKPLVSLAAKLLNKLVEERDWSVQEVSFLLLGNPLVECSRVFVTLDCRLPTEQALRFTIQDLGEEHP